MFQVTDSFSRRLCYNLKHHRQRCGLSQAIIAYHLGVSIPHVSLMESKRRRVTLDKIPTLSRIFGTRVATLLS